MEAVDRVVVVEYFDVSVGWVQQQQKVQLEQHEQFEQQQQQLELLQQLVQRQRKKLKVHHREPQVRKSDVMDGGVRSSVLGGELW